MSGVSGGRQPHAAPAGTCSKSKVTTPSWSTSIAWKNPAARETVIFFFFRGKRGKNEAGVKGKSWKKTGQDLRGKVGKSRQDLKGKVGKSQQDLKGKIRKTEQDLRGEVGKNRI